MAPLSELGLNGGFKRRTAQFCQPASWRAGRCTQTLRGTAKATAPGAPQEHHPMTRQVQ